VAAAVWLLATLFSAAGCMDGTKARRDDYLIYPYARSDRLIADRVQLLRNTDPKLSADAAHAEATAQLLGAKRADRKKFEQQQAQRALQSDLEAMERKTRKP
jgi:hypothetical protein